MLPFSNQTFNYNKSINSTGFIRNLRIELNTKEKGFIIAEIDSYFGKPIVSLFLSKDKDTSEIKINLLGIVLLETHQ